MYKSLERNDIDWEMIMCGSVKGDSPGPKFRHIYSNVKPAQCYEISFRAAQGELLSWTADDATYPPNALDEVYKFYKIFNSNKLVVAFRTIEDGRDITEGHRLRGRDPGAPRMAPFGVMNTEFFRELGGYDRRFICGQSENDVVMRAYEAGGRLEIAPVSVLVHHQQSHDSGTVFRQGFFNEDRKVLEYAWIKDGEIQKKRLIPFEPFVDEDILTKTQSQRGQW
jgi:hypothetical protein